MAGILTIQGTIASTGTAQQLPSNPNMNRTFTFAAKSGNAASIGLSSSSSGQQFLVAAGTSVVLPGLSDTASLWVTGTANDVYSGIAAL